MRGPSFVAAMLVGLGVASAVAQQPSADRVVAGLSAATVNDLESSARVQWDRAETLLESGPADEVLELYRRLMDAHGDQFLERTGEPAMPVGFKRYATVRELAWVRIAGLRRTAPELIDSLRRQMDSQARQWFEQGSSDRTGSVDQRIVDQLFLSRLGDDALLRLGDVALERGAINTARRNWERIASTLRFPPNRHELLRSAANRPLWLPLAGADLGQVWPEVAPILADPEAPTEWVYPDTDLNLPELRARLVLASILEGNLERARVERTLLAQLAPEATGTIAGQSGRLSDLLRAIEEDAQAWQSISPPRDWLTFAGSPSRNSSVPEITGDVRVPLWSTPLPRWTVEHEVLSTRQARVAEDSSGLLPYHPLVVGDLAVVQTGPSRDQVMAYRLRTGEAMLPTNDTPEANIVSYDRRTVLGVPRFVPSAAATHLFVYDGMTFIPATGDREVVPTTLAAIDLAADRRLEWDVGPHSIDTNGTFLLAGPPLPAGPRLLVGLRRRQGLREELHVAALDARDGRLMWRQMIGVAEPLAGTVWSHLSHQLLAADQDTIYCNSNAGLVAALDVATGRIRWITAYPRIGTELSDPDRNSLHLFRDLNPCLVYRDLVVVAPTDSNRLFALDATTGIPVWVTPAELAADAIHLLAATGNQLMVSGECVYWFDIYSGELLGQYPAPFKAATGFARPVPRGYGRGILAGQHLYWPTREAILVFDRGAVDSNQRWRPNLVREIPLAAHGLTGGNLVLARETLLIASADRLVAFDVGKSP